MSKRIFVGSLPWSVTSEELRQLFSTIGKVIDAVVISEKATGRSKGYGFVEMETDAEALAAVEQFNGYDLRGRQLRVNSADPKQKKTLFM